jgi:hypothetical protein
LRYFVWSFLCTAHITSLDYDRYAYPVAGANRRWRCQFRYRGSRRESAVAQLTLGRTHPNSLRHSDDANERRRFQWI